MVYVALSDGCSLTGNQVLAERGSPIANAPSLVGYAVVLKPGWLTGSGIPDSPR